MNAHLQGAFIEEKLVGIFGYVFDVNKKAITLKHIAVSQTQQRNRANA